MSLTQNKLPKVILTRVLLFASLSMLSITFNSCGNGENDAQVDARSLEQIYQDEGVPVRIMEISSTSFSNEMTFLATMLGIQETTVSAKIADRIVAIPVKVGARVSAGQVLAKFPTDSPQLQWEQAKTAYENAKRTWERMKNLLASGDVAQANYDGAETQYLVAKQTFESLRQMVEIDAPFSGTVTKVIAKVGDKVNPGDQLVTIAQTGTMIARIWASETEVRKLRVGMPASIAIDGNEFAGKIATISLGMDQAHKAFQVDVHFNNSKGRIKSGTTTDLVFRTGDNVQSIIIPRRFVRVNGDEQYVFVVNNDNVTAKKIPVKTGLTTGVSITIEEGLNSNDRVITEGASLLENGMKIRIIEL
jgi:RND family efflux transporter MFP subunit